MNVKGCQRMVVLLIHQHAAQIYQKCLACRSLNARLDQRTFLRSGNVERFRGARLLKFMLPFSANYVAALSRRI